MVQSSQIVKTVHHNFCTEKAFESSSLDCWARLQAAPYLKKNKKLRQYHINLPPEKSAILAYFEKQTLPFTIFTSLTTEQGPLIFFSLRNLIQISGKY